MTTTTQLRFSRWQKADLDRVYVNFPRDYSEPREAGQIKVWFEPGDGGRATLRTKAPHGLDRELCGTIESREERAWELAAEIMGGVCFDYAALVAALND